MGRAERLLQGAAEAMILQRGLYGFRGQTSYFHGEPLTLTNGERTIAVEVRVHDITGWENER